MFFIANWTQYITVLGGFDILPCHESFAPLTAKDCIFQHSFVSFRLFFPVHSVFLVSKTGVLKPVIEFQDATE
jgi:hypothetical protein